MNRVRGWCLLIAVALTLALVGCGEDDTSSPTPTVESERIEQPSRPTGGGTRPRTPTATVAPTPAPTSTPAVEVGTGWITLGMLQRLWEAEGLQVIRGSQPARVSGFTGAASDIRLVKGDAATQLTLLIYRDPEDLQREWSTQVGGQPTPKGARKLEGVIATWWNHNVVALVRGRTGTLGGAPLRGYLEADPPE